MYKRPPLCAKCGAELDYIPRRLRPAWSGYVDEHGYLPCPDHHETPVLYPVEMVFGVKSEE